MTLNILAFVGCALAACVLTVVVRQYKPELAVGVSIAVSVVLICSVVFAAAQVIERIEMLSENTGQLKTGLKIIIKAFGICVITQTAADICRDCGETSIAGRIETGGRLAVLIVALPLFSNVLELASELVKL